MVYIGFLPNETMRCRPLLPLLIRAVPGGMPFDRRIGLTRAMGMLALGALAMLPMVAGAGTVHKCVRDGQTSYQQTPCGNPQAPARPTVQQLNAERAERAARVASVRPGPGALAVNPSSVARAEPGPPSPPALAATPARTAEAFRCDGRTHCSQMRSCSEAKFFLARCPGVQMDGDGDGVPCEQQWCH